MRPRATRRRTARQAEEEVLPYRGRAGQVADHLRVLLSRGRWTEGLPGERQLAKEMGVGRMTLRDALAELENEGVLSKSGPGGSRTFRKRKGFLGQTRSIALVAPARLGGLGASNVLLVDELRRTFYSRGYSFAVYESTAASAGRYLAFLKKTVMRARHDCWILLTSTPEIQDWCAREALPVVLAASHYGDITLPSVDVDHRALCRHAAGEFLRRGHRRLALLLARTEMAGDVESRLGFVEGVSAAADATCSVHHHDETVRGLCRLADHLLGVGEAATGWLICRARHFLTIHTHLLRRGVRIPKDLSLVCRDSEVLVGRMVPEPARYVFDAYELAKQVANLALKIAAGRNLAGKHRLILPEFVPGQSLSQRSPNF